MIHQRTLRYARFTAQNWNVLKKETLSCIDSSNLSLIRQQISSNQYCLMLKWHIRTSLISSIRVCGWKMLTNWKRLMAHANWRCQEKVSRGFWWMRFWTLSTCFKFSLYVYGCGTAMKSMPIAFSLFLLPVCLRIFMKRYQTSIVLENWRIMFAISRFWDENGLQVVNHV